MYSTFHSHRISRIICVCVCVCVCVWQNTHRGISFCFCLCFVYFCLSSNVPHTREPCHAHIKRQKLIPLLILSRLCKLCISRRVWQKLSYINLNTGLKDATSTLLPEAFIFGDQNFSVSNLVA